MMRTSSPPSRGGRAERATRRTLTVPAGALHRTDAPVPSWRKPTKAELERLHRGIAQDPDTLDIGAFVGQQGVGHRDNLKRRGGGGVTRRRRRAADDLWFGGDSFDLRCVAKG